MIVAGRGSAARQHSSRHKRDQNIAMMLILLVLVFGFCNSFRIITNLYEVTDVLFSKSVLFKYQGQWENGQQKKLRRIT